MEKLRLLRMARVPPNFKWQVTSGTNSMSSLSVCQYMMQTPTLDSEEGIESPLEELHSALGLNPSRVVHSEPSILSLTATKKQGFDVMVFEKDLSAVRGNGQYRGPIQIQSNALAALEAINVYVADEVMRVGCVTGDKINGLVDGVSGIWYVKFDTFTLAVKRRLRVTRVISRITLQQILARAVGDDIIINGSNVVNVEDVGEKFNVILENGERFEGDIMVGADDIWLKVRKNLFGLSDVVYSGYTCYTGIADCVPVDINYVGYQVFFGHKQYFVSSDVDAGKMQWYAFHKEAPGGVDSPNGKKERLLKIFEGLCDNVLALLLVTEEDAILRRDIYDRTPILTWGKGHVTLLGDYVHALQPNRGQGGCLAIEDGYQLAIALYKAWQKSSESGTLIDINSSLMSYENSRRLRVAIIHGIARMAALMASTYKANLGVGLGRLSFLTKFRIPHQGKVGGRVFIDKAMPLMLSWVLGGNSSKLEGRSPSCRLSYKASDQLRTWFEDDDALERDIDGEWFCTYLVGKLEKGLLNAAELFDEMSKRLSEGYMGTLFDFIYHLESDLDALAMDLYADFSPLFTNNLDFWPVWDPGNAVTNTIELMRCFKCQENQFDMHPQFLVLQLDLINPAMPSTCLRLQMFSTRIGSIQHQSQLLPLTVQPQYMRYCSCSNLSTDYVVCLTEMHRFFHDLELYIYEHEPYHIYIVGVCLFAATHVIPPLQRLVGLVLITDPMVILTAFGKYFNGEKFVAGCNATYPVDVIASLFVSNNTLSLLVERDYKALDSFKANGLLPLHDLIKMTSTDFGLNASEMIAFVYFKGLLGHAQGSIDLQVWATMDHMVLQE